MTPDIFVSRTGSRELLNADHVEHWPIERGHAYLVCDGINHNHRTAAIVRQFSTKLKAADWSYSDLPIEQLTNHILVTLDSISQDDQGTAFCLSIALLINDSMIIGHCGDCRVGHLTNNGVEWLTTDDVPSLTMYQRGLLTKEQYQCSRHLLACKLKTGTRNWNVIKTSVLPKPAPGRLLLCSDGFWAEGEHLLTGSPKQCIEAIKQSMTELNASAQDNFSIIVV